MHLPSYFKLVNDDEIYKIREAAMKILCSYGFRIENDTILKIAEKKGLFVDFQKQWIKITPDIFSKLEDCARSGCANSRKTETLLRRPLGKGFSIGRNIVKYFDWQNNTSRLATLKDNIDIIKASHMLPDVVGIAPIFTSNDIPAEIEPIVSSAAALKYSDKPFSFIEMMMGEQLPYLEELETISKGQQVRYSSSFASITRFTLDHRAASCLEAVWNSEGLTGSWGTNSTPLAGMNAPVTPAGSAALGMAEMIGGWLAGWLLNENVTLGVIPVSGTMDMRSTRIMFSTPQAILTDGLLYQVFDRLYNMNTFPEVTATYIDGKIPGMQSLHDKMFKTMSLFSLTGCTINSTHFGMLESGSSICPAQMILDFEINKEMEQFTKGVQVDDNALCLETLLDVGPNGIFLTEEHTLDNYKDSLWHSNIFDCSPFTDTISELAKEKYALEKAQEKYDFALNSYKGVQISDEKLLAIDKVVKMAENTLL